jgi:type II secretory pathway pseudopilin PulG
MIELMVVIVIIGIVLTLILTAAAAGVRRAEERATQALISKLETGLDDRLQALLQTQPDYNDTHLYMAGIYASGVAPIGLPPSPISQRVNVIARYDQVKAEVPDVFMLNFNPAAGGAIPDYPFNFAGVQFTAGTASTNLPSTAQNYASVFLPLGNGYVDNPTGAGGGTASFGAAPLTITATSPWNSVGTGIYGASYTVASGIYKNLGYSSAGYDGVDNQPPNGLVDEYAEGTMGLSSAQIAQIGTNLSNHTHKTCRAEILYALLVEGQGPLGSVFNRDEFTDKEVQDTDNDGLPEFVDGWGEPLYFYRWPIYYNSDLQRGVPVNNGFNAGASANAPGGGTMNYPYQGVFDAREQDPLDPSQQLMAPSWWSSTFNTGTSSSIVYPGPGGPTFLSPGAQAFSSFFHTLVEPMYTAGALTAAPAAPAFPLWDRGQTFWARRAFFTKFLIVSSGPDKQLGLARLDTLTAAGTLVNKNNFTAADLLIESTARQTNFFDSTNSLLVGSANTNPPIPSYGGVSLYDAAQDDITNHNYQAPGGFTQ